MDLLKEEVKVVPTWIRFPGLLLKYWGQVALNKIASLVGKPIRTDRATTQKDCIEYAKVMVEVKMGQSFPDEIQFLNEKGTIMKQQVIYECKPIICGGCGGIGHTLDMCRQKKYDIAIKKLQPKKILVPKSRAPVGTTQVQGGV